MLSLKLRIREKQNIPIIQANEISLVGKLTSKQVTFLKLDEFKISKIATKFSDPFADQSISEAGVDDEEDSEESENLTPTKFIKKSSGSSNNNPLPKVDDFKLETVE